MNSQQYSEETCSLLERDYFAKYQGHEMILLRGILKATLEKMP